MLKNAKTAFKFCFCCSERLFFSISIYGSLLVNLHDHDQIYLDQQNAREITPENLKITFK